MVLCMHGILPQPTGMNDPLVHIHKAESQENDIFTLNGHFPCSGKLKTKHYIQKSFLTGSNQQSHSKLEAGFGVSVL